MIDSDTAPMIDIDLEIIVCLFGLIYKIRIITEICKRYSISICFSDRFELFYYGACLT